jgi:DNA-binding transcriptional LysR family regulator
VVFPKGDKLEKKRKVKLSEIKDRNFISIWKGSGSRIYIENALAMQKEDMEWAYEVRHIPTALNMVEQGLGITLAPKLAISKDYSSLSYRPLIDPAVTRTIGLIKRSGRELSYDAQKLYELLIEKFKR